MVRALPSIPVEEAIHNVLGVRVFEIGGDDGGKLGASECSCAVAQARPARQLESRDFQTLADGQR